jgi:hypothetical protein
MKLQVLGTSILIIFTSFIHSESQENPGIRLMDCFKGSGENEQSATISSDDPAHSSLVYPGNDGRLVYQPFTPQGDQIPDFSICGYKRSEEPIPNVQVAATVNPLPGVVQPDGTMAYPQGPDSYQQIQDALNEVAALQPNENGFRGAVLLKKGTYYVNGSLVVGSGVVLRGEGDGPDGTVLIFRNPKGNGIELGNPEATIVKTGESLRIKESYLPTGSIQITLDDANLFKTGDYVVVRKTTNDQWIKDLGMDRLSEIRPERAPDVRNWKAESYQFEHVRQIVQVSGNRITLDVQLPQSIAAEHGGGEIEKITLNNVDSKCGVEFLRVVSNYDQALKLTDAKTNMEYYSDEENNLNSGINVTCINGWVRSCTSLHHRFAAVRVNGPSQYTTVRDCQSLYPVSVIRGGRRYSFNISGGSYSLFYNCYSEDGRHDFVAGSRVMGPHAFVKGTAVNSTSTSEPHHRWGTGILFDNITLKYGGSLAALNRGDSGSGHGWAAANAFFWNSNAREVVVMDPQTAENNFAIGYKGEKLDEYPTNLLNYSNIRSNYVGTPREGVYKGVALMGNGFIEHPDRAVTPESLFTQQLIDRIGAEQAAMVLSPVEKGTSSTMSSAVETPEQAFAYAQSLQWDEVLSDEGTGNWTQNWFLDGDKARVINTPEGMELHAGPVPDEDASHAVLWTQQAFEGDLKIEYDYTRLDESPRGVNIIYLLATGSGEEPYAKDITEWNEIRRVPTMSKYFRNMNTYHISYSTNDGISDYVRARRYIPEGNTLRGTDLKPDYFNTGLFLKGVTSHITIIIHGDWMFMEVIHPEQRRLFAWKTDTHPDITEGRIGLRQMFTRSSRYKNIRISLLDE